MLDNIETLERRAKTLYVPGKASTFGNVVVFQCEEETPHQRLVRRARAAVEFALAVPIIAVLGAFMLVERVRTGKVANSLR